MSERTPVIAIVQARMGSTRLPGKVLRDIGGQPMLAHVLRRVLKCGTLDGVVVATTWNPEDEAVVDAARALGVETFAGHPDDVLDRYYQAASAVQAATVVRITADCPVLDPGEVDRLVAHFLDHPMLAYAALGATYPEGYGAEVFTFAALTTAWREARMPSEREHVTPYIWKQPDRFKSGFVELPEDLSDLRMTVDEEADHRVVEAMVRALSPADPFFGVRAAAHFLRAHPEISTLNTHIERQAGYRKSLDQDRQAAEGGRRSPLSRGTDS